VLRVSEGDVLRVGVLGGRVGTAEVLRADASEIVLRPSFDAQPPRRAGVDLLLAVPRPKALRKVLPAAASLGVDRIVLVNAARVEKSYFDSRVLDPQAIRELLILGLEQARDTRLPEVVMRERFRPFVEDELDVLWPDTQRLLAHPGAEAPPRRTAQRAVLAYQPMQHHGFLVVTPRLLLEGAAVLGLPVETLTETRSLLGGAIEVGLDGPGSAASAFARFDSLRRTLQEMSSWPAHTWWLHRAVAMFELAPALYLEACGQPCPKHASFDIARREFPDAWPAYDVLDEVRRTWIRQSSGLVRCGATLTRNPWTTVAALRRIPIRPPHRITELLSDAPPDDLKRVVSLMAARVGKNDRELAHA